jgi:two-component system sensor histidine kinase BaeS
MIRIGITYRLFLSILAATCAAILCMFLVMHWSINRGFLRYLDTMAQAGMESVSSNLARAYASHGNWDFLRAEPAYWVTRALHEHDESAPSARQGQLHPPRLPLVVLDADRRSLFGHPGKEDTIKYKPIIHNGSTVGYVGHLPPRQFLSPPQLQFLQHQKSALITAVLGLVLVVVVFSLPLARRLIRPVRTIAAATRELASGRYTVRVPVTSSDELGQLASSFNAMAVALEKNEKARRQWVADISHELRTPIAVLRGEIEALMEGVRETTPEAVRSLHSEVMRLNRLVDDLHQLTLSDLGALTYRKESIDLMEVLTDSVDAHRAEFDRKDITLDRDIPRGQAQTPVFADRERLRQLFSNLLGNSLKYTDSGGRLVVRVRRDGAIIVVELEDSAPGVPADEMEKLFDRLYRVETSRSRTSGGAGLGLAICRNIVEAHGGTITASPSPLGGLLMRVSIPVEETSQ